MFLRRKSQWSQRESIIISMWYIKVKRTKIKQLEWLRTHSQFCSIASFKSLILWQGKDFLVCKMNVLPCENNASYILASFASNTSKLDSNTLKIEIHRIPDLQEMLYRQHILNFFGHRILYFYHYRLQNNWICEIRITTMWKTKLKTFI